ncbi:hypothetical protein BHYA_0048g00400 [Botrytis hyacinthi]|uniref:C2H2-type domain-containing protein n=1 Tax=Botrytis hyacinthi TaxID=278943 RepID=A0A4Z1GSM9_9HELO|nr:hypothetical protein BHYA_0048g00400 [Botrytis hyacinthi]
MSTTTNKEQSNDIIIGKIEASLGHSCATFPFTHPVDNVLYDNVETLDIFNWSDNLRADQTVLLPTEFNHSNVPNWYYNSIGDLATGSFDPFMNFQNFTPFEENTASSDDRYFQGLWDGIDAAINLHGQETNFFVSAPNTITEQDLQGFISGEVDTNIAFIGQQATPPAPLIGSFANQAAPDPRFACNFIGCGETFGRQSDCNRHMKKHEAPEYSCPEPGCGREFYRRDKVMDHARRIHHLEL